MYIVAIGYAYVILMMVVTAESLWSGLAVFLFLGLLPGWLFVKLVARRIHPPLDALRRKPDGGDAEQD